MKRIILFLLFFGANELFAQSSFSMLQEQFKHLADGTRPGCFWYWLNDNVSKEGITKDLEAMQRVGIGKAFIGQIYDRRKETDTPPGTVKFMSDEWWQLLQWAVKEADRCNIEIGFFNGPGWSQSGGPWVKLSESMRYITSSEIEVKGGKLVDITLPYPAINTYPNTRAARVRTGPDFTAASFQDVRVIAFPKITDRSNAYRRQMLHSSISNIGHLSDSFFRTYPASRCSSVAFSSLMRICCWPDNGLNSSLIRRNFPLVLLNGIISGSVFPAPWCPRSSLYCAISRYCFPLADTEILQAS